MYHRKTKTEENKQTKKKKQPPYSGFEEKQLDTTNYENNRLF